MAATAPYNAVAASTVTEMIEVGAKESIGVEQSHQWKSVVRYYHYS